MSQEVAEGLLEMIRTDPADDVARLVYADYLDESGDQPRAEFIRLQCRRASLPAWDPEAVTLELRERALLAAHEEAWRSDLPVLEGVTWGSFRRGFVARVGFEDLEQLSAHLPEVRARIPVDGVAVRWPEEAEWDKIELGAGVRSLTLVGVEYEDKAVEGLPTAPFLAGLRELNLIESAMDEAELEALLSSPHLRGLTALRMPLHMLETLRPLESAVLPALTTLDLSVACEDELGSGGRDGDTLDAAAMKSLVRWAGLANLRSLDLSGNHIGTRGLTTLLSGPIGKLTELHIRELSEDGVAFTGLAKAPAELALEVLALQDPLDLAGANQLAAAACLAGLKALTLQSMSESDDGAYMLLAEAAWFDELRRLTVQSGDGGPMFDAVLTRKPKRLHTLELLSCAVRARSARISELASLDSLLALDLSFNRVADACMAPLTDGAAPKNLQSLRIKEYGATDAALIDRLAASALGERLASFELGAEARRGPAAKRPSKLPRPEPPSMEVYGTYYGPLLDL